MIACRIEVTPHSPLLLGSGSGFGSLVDTDTVYDDLGLPYFPARRLKGLLRESAAEVTEMLAACGLQGFSEQDVEEVFGSGEKAPRVQFNDLHLEDYDQVYSLLKSTGELYPTLVNPSSILESLTEIRQQTALKERVAQAHSLRSSRVMINRDHHDQPRCFSGEILVEADEGTINLLALAALNLRNAGSQRNRGIGKISCRIFNRQADVTASIFEGLRAYQIDSSSYSSLNAMSVINAEKRMPITNNNDSARAYLPLSIVARSPLLFTSPEGDQNTVQSLDYIPGVSILGFFAAQYIRLRGIDAGIAHTDPIFRRWFLEGGIKFMNAYLTKEEDDDDEYHLSAVPLCLHTNKEKRPVFNLVESLPSEELDTKSIGGWGKAVGNELMLATVSRNMNFHLRRNTGKGRLTGHTAADGDIFNYEAIAPRQMFWTVLAGSRADLEAFSQFFRPSDNKDWLKARLGRSLNTGYGQAGIKFSTDSPVSEWRIPLWGRSIFAGAEDDNPADSKDEFLLLLTSPAILVNKNGYPDVSLETLNIYLDSYLPGRMKVDNQYPLDNMSQAAPEQGDYFTRRENRDSFVSHWKLPRPTSRVLAAGSIFRVKIDNLDEEILKVLACLQREGLGERRHEGYGQVQLLCNMDSSWANLAQTGDKRSKLTKSWDPDQILPPLASEIFQTIIEERWKNVLAERASQAAADFHRENLRSLLPSSLLGRLERFLADSYTVDELIKKLKALRRTSSDKLNKYCFDETTLYSVLMDSETNYLEEALKTDEMRQAMDLSKRADLRVDFLSIDNFRFYWQVFLRTTRKLNKIAESANQRKADASEGGGPDVQ